MDINKAGGFNDVQYWILELYAIVRGKTEGTVGKTAGLRRNSQSKVDVLLISGWQGPELIWEMESEVYCVAVMPISFILCMTFGKKRESILHLNLEL